MQKIYLETQDDNLIKKLKRGLPDYRVVPLKSVKALSRLDHLIEASNGSILFTDNSEYRSYPMFIGKVSSVTVESVDASLAYTLNRLNNIPENSTKNFIGSVVAYPRDIFVVANTKSWLTEAESLLETLPESFWMTTGFVTVNNANKLLELYDDVFHYSTFLAMDKSSKSKLEYAELDFIDISDIPRDVSGGLTIRELTRRVEMWETKEIDTEFKREG